jgi:hypothetical protein
MFWLQELIPENEQCTGDRKKRRFRRSKWAGGRGGVAQALLIFIAFPQNMSCVQRVQR